MRKYPRTLSTLLILAAIFIRANAQTFSFQAYTRQVIDRNNRWPNEFIRELRVGDTIPDISISNVHNSCINPLNIRQIKKKLTILDFWGVFCSACISSLPSSEQLQKDFNNDIQIILITRDNEAAVSNVLSMRKDGVKCTLPMYNDDKIFYKYFAYLTLPEYVWIDECGVILAIGHGLQNRENIKRYLETKVTPDIQNISVYFDFDRSKSALIEGNSRNFNKVQYYSAILDTLNGLGGSNRRVLTRDSISGKVTTIYLDNLPLIMLFRFMLLGEHNSLVGTELGYIWDFKRILFEVRDSATLRRSGINLNAASHQRLFSYELHIPNTSKISAFEFMRQDLERHFNLICSIENRLQDCYLILKDDEAHNKLTSLSTSSKLQTGNSSINFNKANRTYEIRNIQYSDFEYFLQNKVTFQVDQVSRPIIIAPESGTAAEIVNLDIKIARVNAKNANTEIDFLSLTKSLLRYGYRVKLTQASIPMMTITDVF